MPIVKLKGEGRKLFLKQINLWLQKQPTGDLRLCADNVLPGLDADRRRQVLSDLFTILRACPVDFCEALLAELRPRQQSGEHQQQSTG